MGQTSLGLGLGGITTPQKPLGVSAIGVALDDASGFFLFRFMTCLGGLGAYFNYDLVLGKLVLLLNWSDCPTGLMVDAGCRMRCVARIDSNALGRDFRSS